MISNDFIHIINLLSEAEVCLSDLFYINLISPVSGKNNECSLKTVPHRRNLNCFVITFLLVSMMSMNDDLDHGEFK